MALRLLTLSLWQTSRSKPLDCGSKLAGTFKRLYFRLLAHWRMCKHINGSHLVPSFSSPLGGQAASLVPVKVTDRVG